MNQEAVVKGYLEHIEGPDFFSVQSQADDKNSIKAPQAPHYTLPLHLY